ncbi:hypothetical protein ACFL0W_02420 [Nanoarchaeota archaeon]
MKAYNRMPARDTLEEQPKKPHKDDLLRGIVFTLIILAGLLAIL